MQNQILSIAKALPLPIHPDKELARKLHKNDQEKFGNAKRPMCRVEYRLES